MTHSNVELVRQLFDRFATGGIEPTLDLFTEDVAIEIPPDLSAEPDDYHGREGVRRYFAGFDGMLEEVRYEAIELVPAGQRVLAHIRLSGRGVSSGLDVDLEAYVVHELVGGRIARIRPYASRDAAERAISAG